MHTKKNHLGIFSGIPTSVDRRSGESPVSFFFIFDRCANIWKRDPSFANYKWIFLGILNLHVFQMQYKYGKDKN